MPLKNICPRAYFRNFTVSYNSAWCKILLSFWNFNSLKFLWALHFLRRHYLSPLFYNIITLLLVLKEHIEYGLDIDERNEGLKLFRVFLEICLTGLNNWHFCFKAFSYFSAFEVLTCTAHLQIIYPDCIPNAQVISSWVLLPQSYRQIY